MMCDFRRTFFPTEEEKEQDKKHLQNIWNKLKQNRGCLTCANCIHKRNYPGFVLGEECDCTEGLECDTILGGVKNCTKYKEADMEGDKA